MEIEGGVSSNTEALAAFNQVRTRAGLEPLNQIDRDIIMQERRAEFAFEVEPGTFSTQKLHWYKDSGVNRISMGIQSFDDEIIKFLNMLDDENAGRIFGNLPIEKEYELFKVSDRKTFARFFTHMYSDSRADLFQEFSKEEQIEILPFLDKKTRDLGYFDSNYISGCYGLTAGKMFKDQIEFASKDNTSKTSPK